MERAFSSGSRRNLERETQRTGCKLTQREFVLGLIEEALNEAERQADAGPCKATETEGGSQEQCPQPGR